MDAPPVIGLSHFGKRYGKSQAVRGASFQVQKGSLYGLIGPDAAGKSSILKSIAGVLSYEEGAVEVFGVPIDSEESGEVIKGRLGFMPQGLGLNLYPELTVDENADFFADLRLVPRSKYAGRKEELFRVTRLDEFRTRKMKNLSGGMKQKLGLVCALVHDPELLILDEPTTGVDPVSRRDFWTILSRAIHQGGITAIVSTAYMDEASRFDRVSLLHQGQQLAEGPPAEIVASLPGTVVSLSCTDQVAALRRLRQVFPRADSLGNLLRVRVEAGPVEAVTLVKDVLAGFETGEIGADAATLEDAFVFMLGEREPDEGSSSEPTAQSSAGTRRDEIVARRLTKIYDEFVAVDRFSITVRGGEIFGLLGANGAGKTTVIKMLTGIIPPTAGHGQIAGADMRRTSLEVKRRIGYVSQSYSLYQDLTVQENIQLYAGIYGLTLSKAKQRAEWILDFGGLRPYVKVKSGRLPIGLRQRLALGCALVHEPRVLFLDEPTSGVDPLGRRTIWDLLFRLSREHSVAVLVTTHYMSEAEHCDHLALMHSGRIVAAGSPTELKSRFSDDAGNLLEIEVANLDEAAAVLESARLNPTLHGRSLHVLSGTKGKQAGTPKERIGRLLQERGVQVRSINEVPVTMEDVFVSRISQLEQGTLEDVA